MKKVLVSLLACAIMLPDCFAQNDNYIRPTSIGVSFFFNDYTTPARIRSGSLSTVLREDQWAKFREMYPGLALSYIKGLRNHIDFTGTLAGSFARVPLPDQVDRPDEKFLLEGDASVNFKMLSDRYILTPYLIAGIGASYYDGKVGAFMPLGGGLKVNFFDEAALFITNQYRVPVTTETSNYHFFYSIGFAGVIGKRKEPPVKELPIPQQPKDSDNDGITDDQDQCPQVVGLAKYKGCPIPDTDSDGINDEEDQCKEQAGVAKYGGCPVPDTDSDGVNDEQDKCPQVPGMAEDAGCPVVSKEIQKKIEYAARNIYFNTGSAKLLSKSFAPLDSVVKVLTEDPNLKLSIEGHTDNVGKEDANQQLSENRAQAVKDYLIGKGIDEGRITSQGFGETNPVADNNTAEGRARNRRVLLVVNY